MPNGIPLSPRPHSTCIFSESLIRKLEGLSQAWVSKHSRNVVTSPRKLRSRLMGCRVNEALDHVSSALGPEHKSLRWSLFQGDAVQLHRRHPSKREPNSDSISTAWQPSTAAKGKKPLQQHHWLVLHRFPNG